MENSKGVEPQIMDYILQAQRHGLTDIEIKQNLLNAGWGAEAVEENFVFAKASDHKAQEALIKPAAVARPQQPTTSPQPAAVLPVSQPSPIVQPTLIKPVSQPAASSQPALVHQAVQATPALPAQPAVAHHSSKKWVLAVLVLVLLGAGGGAFAYYQHFYTKVEGVWKRFLAANVEEPKIFKTDFDLNYSFEVRDFATDSSDATPVSVGLKGTSYSDTSDPKDLKASTELNVSTQAEGQSYSFGTTFLFLNKVFFVDLGRVQFLKSMIPEAASGWVKIDFDNLIKFVEEQGGESMDIKNPFDQIGLSDDKLTFQKLAQSNVVKANTLVGKEEFNGNPVYHFKNDFDVEAFLQAYQKYINEQLVASGAGKKTLSEVESKMISAIIRKFEIKEFESWIGQKDFQVYKVRLVLSMPSLADFQSDEFLDFGPLAVARAKSRDAKRLADIRQLSSAFEWYYNDFNGYPAGQDGKPVGFAPDYIGMVPEAPATLDGSCTEYYNGYWYEAAGNPIESNGVTVYPSYNLTFCLGEATGGYEGGIGKMTPQGIEGGIPCPTTEDQCVRLSSDDEVTVFAEALSKIKFTGELKLEASYKDFGKTENLVAPTGAEDLVDLINEALGEARQMSDDAKRLADIRQLSSALELYFNEYESYPENLEAMTPMIIENIPLPPAVVSGTCTAQDNQYVYTRLTPATYTLTFCLGNPVAGYAAGKHSLTQSGIQ